MNQNTFLAQIRAYAVLALRKRVSYVDAVRAIAVARWATVSEGITDPTEREAARVRLASQVVRDYGQSDPQFQPDESTAEGWFTDPT